MKPDLDAILARIGVTYREHPPCASEDVSALLAYIDELEREIAELKARITTLEAMR